MCTSMESDCDSGFADTQRTSESDTDSSKTGIDLELPSIKTPGPNPSPRTRDCRRDFTTNNALNLLEDCEFPINSKGEKLARNMGISLNERHRLRALANTQSLNYEAALEEAIDMFERASTRPVTWDTFILRVENVDQLTATKMRRKLGITATPKKLQKICDSRILFRISGRMDPSLYVSHFALESECDEIHRRCASKDTSALFINLDMLFKWKKRRGPEATYQALLEIFQQENDEKMIDLVLKYAENKHSIHSFGSEDFKFLKVSNKDDIPELEKQHTEIKNKFAYFSLQIIKSLEKTQRPRHIAYYVTKTSRFQFESTDDITDIIAKTSSWFNIKVLRSLVDCFGNDDDKESLSHYERDLRAYLQQSLFNIPAESFQSSNDTSDVTICYLKIPDEDVEMLDLSGEDVLQIERNLADYLGIPHEAFNLCEYRLGCIELVFSIPTTLYESLQKNVVLDRFKNEFRLTVDLQDIMPSHLAKLYIPNLKPSVLTEKSHMASEEPVEDTIYLAMEDKCQQMKPSTCSITQSGETGCGKSSLINTLLPERVRNDDEFEDSDSYFGSESDIQTDSDDDETYSLHKVKTTSTSREVIAKKIADIDTEIVDIITRIQTCNWRINSGSDETIETCQEMENLVEGSEETAKDTIYWPMKYEGRNDDEFESTDSYFGSESDIQTDSDDDETYSSHIVETTSTSFAVHCRNIIKKILDIITRKVQMCLYTCGINSGLDETIEICQEMENLTEKMTHFIMKVAYHVLIKRPELLSKMRFLSRIRHPNLLRFMRTNRVGGNPMILTELMPKGVHKELGKIHRTHCEIITIAGDVASLLSCLHFGPILHRDISSANVLLEPSSASQWHAKISDFGSANVQLIIPPHLRNDSYMAPETLSHHLSSRENVMDIYIFSVAHLEIATQYLPLYLNPNFSITSLADHCITHGERSGGANVGTREDTPIGEKEIVIVGIRGTTPLIPTTIVLVGIGGTTPLIPTTIVVVGITGTTPLILTTTMCLWLQEVQLLVLQEIYPNDIHKTS